MEMEKPSTTADEDLDQVMKHQEKMIKTGNYSKHKPLMQIKKDKQFFDSADYNMREDHQRDDNQKIQKAYYEEVKKMESDVPEMKRHPLIKQDPKTGFDSAEYFMNKAQEEQEQEEKEKNKSQLEEVGEAEDK